MKLLFWIIVIDYILLMKGSIMRQLFSYTEKGTGTYNEDIVGFFGNVAWVIDGATSIFPNTYPSTGKNDVVWIVEQVENWLPHFIDDECSLEEILSKTMAQVKKEAYQVNDQLEEVKGYELPTFTVVLVRQINQQLEYYLLGDSGFLIESKNMITYFTDKRLQEFSERNKKVIDQLKSSVNIDNPKLLKALQEQRKCLNTEEGYWIGSIDGKGISHGITGKMTLDEQTRILCFSDGYSRLFELYRAIDINDFLLEEAFVTKTIRQIRDIEEKDKDGSLYPRPKKSDDLSVILIETSPFFQSLNEE